VAGSDWHRPAADAREHEVRVARHKWSGAERGEHAAAVVDAGREISASTDHGPCLDVGAAQSEDAARAGGTAGLVHARDLRRRRAEVAPERRRFVDRLFEVGLGAERKLDDVFQREPVAWDAGLAEPARI